MSADKPTIRTRADLDLWLDGWDAGTAATLRTLAAIPADMLPAVVARWTADHTRSGAVAGNAPTDPPTRCTAVAKDRRCHRQQGHEGRHRADEWPPVAWADGQPPERVGATRD